MVSTQGVIGSIVEASSTARLVTARSGPVETWLGSGWIGESAMAPTPSAAMPAVRYERFVMCMVRFPSL